VLFEYGKAEGYWDSWRLLEQIEKKALPIAEALYPGYEFLFLFDVILCMPMMLSACPI
jgi:hypothetical protein